MQRPIGVQKATAATAKTAAATGRRLSRNQHGEIPDFSCAGRAL